MIIVEMVGSTLKKQLPPKLFQPGAMYTTFHFICKLVMWPISYSVCPQQASEPSVIQRSNLFGTFVSYKENGVL